MKKLEIKIKGSSWKILLVTEKQYAKRFPERENAENEEALTLRDAKREIWFKKNYIKPSTVYHELLHAFVGECNIFSSNLTSDQIEELCCEIVGEHFSEMFVLCNKIITFAMES